MANRGTKLVKLPKNPENWTGKEFRKYLDGTLDKADDNESVSINRGTKQIKVKDLKKKKGTDRKKASKGRYVSTGRGTGRRKL